MEEDSLTEYHKKRNFSKTREPEGVRGAHQSNQYS